MEQQRKGTCIRIAGNTETPALPGRLVPSKLALDPLQATFRGGCTEALHGWYPYLEGYSPEFVNGVLAEFAPRATRILDPFSGLGTTPLTSAQSGKAAFYCELNPLLQFLTETKISALAMSGASRQRLAVRLEALADGLHRLVDEARPDPGLDAAYKQTFGASRFFEEPIYDQVLRMRTVIDQAACREREIADLICVAVLGSLIPASLLIRRGDVRFKNEKELAASRTGFLGAIKDRLILIGRDLCRLNAPISCRPQLVVQDARDLDKVPSLEVDAVITSPPYLNGTNYFRNTKIELWFLRCLTRPKDLADFRFRAVTAGINDVTVDKPWEDVSPGVRNVVERLRESAYDPRIPRMIATYFADLRAVVRALRGHLRKHAMVLIDLGDSAYGGVHVPTPALLADILHAENFTLEQEITLRQRKSRGGFPLRQVLLAFRYQEAPCRCPIKDKPPWRPPWEAFKAKLPHQHGAFAKRNWGHPLHSLCSYQGKMKPSLAHFLVNTFVPAGGQILDPFGGVGTIPFEAALNGKRTWTFEISPAAFAISAAKLGRPRSDVCEAILEDLASFARSRHVRRTEITSAERLRFNGQLADYFHPDTFREILLCRRFFLEGPPRCPSAFLVHACLLHILHGNRPYALSRRSHPITPFAPSGASDYRAVVPRLREKVRRSLTHPLPSAFVEGQTLFQDATSWWPQEIHDLDAIITSPPFFDSTRFYLANWMRLWFCGWEIDDFAERPLKFVDLRQKLGFSVYAAIFRQARERLKKDGVLVLHLGRSKKCDMASELAAIARPWFQCADLFTENVGHCESHGIRDKGTVQEHAFLVLD